MAGAGNPVRAAPPSVGRAEANESTKKNWRVEGMECRSDGVRQEKKKLGKQKTENCES
jgi:hypothetical protein